MVIGETESGFLVFLGCHHVCFPAPNLFPVFELSWLDPCDYYMDLCNQSWLASQLCPVVKTLRWTLHANCSTKLFHTWHVYRHYWLLPFNTTFTDLDLAWGSQDQCLASFSCTLFIWSGWNLVCCWRNSSGTSWYYFWVRFIETWKITAVLHTASKNLNVGMHLYVNEWIWFKLGILIDAVVLYILILV